MKLLSKLLMLLYFGVCRNVGFRVLIVVFLGALWLFTVTRLKDSNTLLLFALIYLIEVHRSVIVLASVISRISCVSVRH